MSIQNKYKNVYKYGLQESYPNKINVEKNDEKILTKTYILKLLCWNNCKLILI
jgi:hypothetical protein